MKAVYGKITATKRLKIMEENKAANVIRKKFV